jgi:hypothetical protein
VNETDVRNLFASAVTHPAVDRIDTEAVIRGGRRRRRVRVTATIGTAIAVVAVAGTLVISGTRHPDVVVAPTPSAGTCQDLTPTPTGSPQDQAAVGAAAHDVLAAANALPASNLTGVIVRPADRTVDVLWVGPVPDAMTQVASAQTSKNVTVEFVPARYTLVEMQAALEVAARVPAPADDPASQGLAIASGAPCHDGSGIKITIEQKVNHEPAESVPPAFAAAIRSSAGQMPVWIEPGAGYVAG